MSRWPDRRSHCWGGRSIWEKPESGLNSFIDFYQLLKYSFFAASSFDDDIVNHFIQNRSSRTTGCDNSEAIDRALSRNCCHTRQIVGKS